MHLDLLPYASRADVREVGGERQIRCGVRRRWLVATPEEFVRQGLIAYLREHGYPASLMQVERAVGNSRDRLDLLVLTRAGGPYVLAEAKAPGYDLQPAVAQLARYNRHWRAPYTLAVNGERAICCALDYASEQLSERPGLPPYPA